MSQFSSNARSPANYAQIQLRDRRYPFTTLPRRHGFSYSSLNILLWPSVFIFTRIGCAHAHPLIASIMEAIPTLITLPPDVMVMILKAYLVEVGKDAFRPHRCRGSRLLKAQLPRCMNILLVNSALHETTLAVLFEQTTSYHGDHYVHRAESKPTTLSPTSDPLKHF